MDKAWFFGTGLLLGLLLGLAGTTGAAQDLGLRSESVPQAFTYQGLLNRHGAPAHDSCDLRFSLFDAASDGNQVGPQLTRIGVTVFNGLFTIPDLNFGNQHFGQARWLQIEVQCPGDVGYITLSPRQALTPPPYAFHWGGTWTGPGTGLELSGGSIGLLSEGSDRGVSGQSLSQSGFGIVGYADGSEGMGVYGLAGSASGATYGVYGQTSSTTGFGVYGRAASSTANYGVYSFGNTGATGTKSAVVQTQDYGWRHLYAVESPRVLFEDVGTAQLINGRAVVIIDPTFVQTVNLNEPYQVFVTPLGDCGLYVTEKTGTSFTVNALDGRTCSLEFDYRIIAARLGYEEVRLAPALDPAELSLPELRR